MRTMLKSKIHRIRVTGADVTYEGSITLDPLLMEAADIIPYEQVHVLDVDNGSRLTTYAIEGDRASGQVVVNGAAARLISDGDTPSSSSLILISPKPRGALIAQSSSTSTGAIGSRTRRQG